MQPWSVDRARVARADLERCQRLLRDGSRSFFVASRLLPVRIRDAATAMYAFCRVADDLVDRTTAGAAGVARLRDRIDRVYRGQPFPRATDRAFADVVERFAIPRDLPLALVEGLEWDLERRGYETIDALHGYAARVASSVGVMMSLVMGARTPDQLARACELGVAMQLTNIARDVGEDAAMGRLYLPAAWMRDAGLDPAEWLARPVFDRRIASVVARLLSHADDLYRRADEGIATLPRGCRPGIRAARLVYWSIGSEIARRGWDSVSGRAVVSSQRKVALAARAMVPRWSRASGLSAAPLEAVRFLVEAASASTPAAPRARISLTDRIVWALELFEKLERAEFDSGARRTPG
jgi:15-cis-phytoene synthase